MTKGIALCCFVAALIMIPASAFAWGNEGHRIVCRIALDRLSPAGLAFVDAVRALHTEVQDPFSGCQNCSSNHPSDGRDMSFLEGCI